MPTFLERLFKRKSSAEEPPHPVVTSAIASADNDYAQEPAKTAPAEPPPLPDRSPIETPQLAVGVARSIGVQRDSNEDALFTFTTNLVSDRRSINFGLFIVADGMGGHENGELASSIAVEKLSAYVLAKFYLPLVASPDSRVDVSVQEILQAGVMSAHSAIKQVASGSGTTLTAAMILGDHLTIAHVGDSRAYTLATGGQLQLLTHDHSLVKRLEEIGQISPDEALTHPKRNLLYRALGQGEPVEVDISSFNFQPGQDLLLCTDGLWGVVPEDEIERAMRSPVDPHDACQALADSANAAGGPDNITMIMVRFPA